LGGRPWQASQAQVFAALRSVTEEMVMEIQRSFEFYLASAGDDPIEQVYLSGGCASLTGMSQLLTSRLKLPVELFNPFRRITIPQAMFGADYVLTMGPMAAVAVGLAIRQKGDS
jgi:type IV pilus assembly protein PilM